MAVATTKQRVRGARCYFCEKPARRSFMFCSDRCAARLAREMFENSTDWAWCPTEGTWVNENAPGVKAWADVTEQILANYVEHPFVVVDGLGGVGRCVIKLLSVGVGVFHDIGNLCQVSMLKMEKNVFIVSEEISHY